MKKVKVFIEFPGITTGELNEEYTFSDEEIEEIDLDSFADDIFYSYCRVSYSVEDVEG